MIYYLNYELGMIFVCRDLVHRQTACWAVKHMSLGVYGFGCEDALTHLMNYVWPNIFEISPHMMQSFNDAVEGFRVSVGPGRVLLYTLQVRVAHTHTHTHTHTHLYTLVSFRKLFSLYIGNTHLLIMFSLLLSASSPHTQTLGSVPSS